ncbi:hypothetical protein SAMN06295924_1245 [Rathayibacter rathayi NCPPB 2980 = VKM Ac-1601]|nr:hypothetical protein SAMN06295924_1245 [Rathayibacter rathayi NCPPB 2980 = VKM Ac-1601]
MRDVEYTISEFVQSISRKSDLTNNLEIVKDANYATSTILPIYLRKKIIYGLR